MEAIYIAIPHEKVKKHFMRIYAINITISHEKVKKYFI